MPEAAPAGPRVSVARVGALPRPTLAVAWSQTSRAHGALARPLRPEPVRRRTSVAMAGTASSVTPSLHKEGHTPAVPPGSKV